MFEQQKNRKKSILMTFLLLIALLISGIGMRVSGLTQNSSLEYRANIIVDQTFGGPETDYAYSVINTSDGGFAIAGHTSSYGAGSSDMWLVKTDATGQVEWEQYYGGTRSDYGFAVVATEDGGYAWSGGTESFGAGDSDMWLVKTNNLGEIEWNQTFGGIEDDYAFPIIHTADKGFLLFGRTHSFGFGDSDICLVKFDSQGEIEWNQSYGGRRDDSGTDAIKTPDGGYVLVGGTDSYGSRDSDVWVVKINNLGEIEWSRIYGGENEDRAMSVILDTTGGYVVTGLTQSFGAGRRDIWLIKFNSTGYPEWSQTFGGYGNDYADCVIMTSDGGYALAGRTSSIGTGSEDMWLVKTNSSGQMEWNQTFGGSDADVAYSVVETVENEFVLIGRTDSKGVGGTDLWLLKVKMVLHDPKATSMTISNITFILFIVLTLISRKKRKTVLWK
jgi:hypothetical protein